MKKAFYLLIALLLPVSVLADSLSVIRTIPVKGRIMQVDELGNAYVVTAKNELIRYTPAGDSSTSFRSVSNGPVGYIDVTNPLRILVYFPDFNKLLLLDRMLSLKNELNLRKLNFVNSSLVAVSEDANLWVYDQFSATLNKLDMQLNYMIRGNDLRQQLSVLPAPVFMTERERKVYMSDTAAGILIFDQYGSYINTLSIFGVQELQVVGKQLIYLKQNTLYAYDIQQFRESVINIPVAADDKVIQAALCRSVLYVLYQDHIVLYKVQ